MRIGQYYQLKSLVEVHKEIKLRITNGKDVQVVSVTKERVGDLVFKREHALHDWHRKITKTGAILEALDLPEFKKEVENAAVFPFEPTMRFRVTTASFATHHFIKVLSLEKGGHQFMKLQQAWVQEGTNKVEWRDIEVNRE